MPPPASHRLDLLLLAPTPEAPGAWADAALDRWRTEGFVVGDAPGPNELVAGGFAGVWVESDERERFFANRQGGFRVRCPLGGANVVPAFNPAMTAWRSRNGPRHLVCPDCGAVHDLAALDYAPPAGFARGVVVIAEAEASELSAAGLAALGELGPGRLVLRRG